MGKALIIIMLGLAAALFCYLTFPQYKEAISKKAQKAIAAKQKPESRPFSPEDNTLAAEEGWTGDDDIMVLVQPDSDTVPPFYIDAFEATVSSYRAWSVPGQKPTDKIRYGDAYTACQAAGKRLCYLQEWQTACRGGSTEPLVFTNVQPILEDCDFARSYTYDKYDYVETTDSHMACTPGGLPIFHIVGNVAEFVQDAQGQSIVAGLTYYDGKIKDRANAAAYACERIIAGPGQFPASHYNKGLGFRCCKSAGQEE